MTMAGRLLMFANLVTANAAAVAWAVSFAFPGVLGTPPTEGEGAVLILPLRTSTALGVLVFAVLLLFFNATYLLRRRPAKPLRFVLSAAPGGAVRVSRDALETGMRQAGEALAEITRLRIAVESGGLKKIVIRGQFQCPEGISNLEASRLLRRALGERFAEMVQLTDGNKLEMEIEFLGFAGKLNRKASEPPDPEPEPSPFTGPEYPIDDEGGEDRGAP